MTDQYRTMLDHTEAKALAGDPLFAIAFGLVALASEHRALQENLTFGDMSDPARTQGVLERMAMNVGAIGDHLGALSQVAERLTPDE